MRLYIILFITFGLILTINAKRKIRQINNGDNLFDPSSENWAWDWDGPVRSSTPTRPTRPTRPTTRPTIPTIPTAPPTSNTNVTPNTAIFDRCMRNCLRTIEYNPICADIGNGTRKQYTNAGEMNCAAGCGESSTMLFYGSCTSFI